MKKFTRDRVVPTISASVSCDSFGRVRGGVLLAVARQEQQRPRQPLLARVEELIDQVLFDADVPREHVGDESIGELRLCVQRSDHLLFLDAQHVRRHHGRGGAHAERLSGEAPFAEEITRAEHRHHGLLAGRGQDGELDGPILKIEHAVGRRALREHDRAAGEAAAAARHASRREEFVDVQWSYRWRSGRSPTGHDW